MAGAIEGERRVEDDGRERLRARGVSRKMEGGRVETYQGDKSEALERRKHQRGKGVRQGGEREERRAMAFQLMGSTKELTTPAKVSAPTLALPTTVGSRFMQCSQPEHACCLFGSGDRSASVLKERARPRTWLERAGQDRIGW